MKLYDKNQKILIVGSYKTIKELCEKNYNLENADLKNADLENADLKNADLENADLRNAYLENADLHNANLENANLENANLRNNNVKITQHKDNNLYEIIWIPHTQQLQIGCEIHNLNYWREHYKEITQQHEIVNVYEYVKIVEFIIGEKI